MAETSKDRISENFLSLSLGVFCLEGLVSAVEQNRFL